MKSFWCFALFLSLTLWSLQVCDCHCYTIHPTLRLINYFMFIVPMLQCYPYHRIFCPMFDLIHVVTVFVLNPRWFPLRRCRWTLIDFSSPKHLKLCMIVIVVKFPLLVFRLFSMFVIDLVDPHHTPLPCILHQIQIMKCPGILQSSSSLSARSI